MSWGVPVVISLHLEVEDLALGCGGVLDEILLEQGEHVVADVAQLRLHLLTVLSSHRLDKKGR